MVEKSRVEKSRVEKSRVEKSGVEKSGVEMSFNLPGTLSTYVVSNKPRY
jgi:hypothetical protein